MSAKTTVYVYTVTHEWAGTVWAGRTRREAEEVALSCAPVGTVIRWRDGDDVAAWVPGEED